MGTKIIMVGQHGLKVDLGSHAMERDGKGQGQSDENIFHHERRKMKTSRVKKLFEFGVIRASRCPIIATDDVRCTFPLVCCLKAEKPLQNVSWKLIFVLNNIDKFN